MYTCEIQNTDKVVNLNINFPQTQYQTNISYTLEKPFNNNVTASIDDTNERLQYIAVKIYQNEPVLETFDGKFFKSIQFIPKTVFTSGYIYFTFPGSDLVSGNIDIKLLNNFDSVEYFANIVRVFNNLKTNKFL